MAFVCESLPFYAILHIAWELWMVLRSKIFARSAKKATKPGVKKYFSRYTSVNTQIIVS